MTKIESGLYRQGVLAAVAAGLALLATVGTAQTAGSTHSEAGRAWTIKDSIETTYYAESIGDLGQISPSPDGSKFLFITQRGSIDADANVYKLENFNVSTVRRSLADPHATLPQPLRAIEFRSQTNEPAISGALWNPDGTTVLFLGVSG